MNKQLKQYHWVNNCIGWLIGIAASMVFILTAEATASWWDCGEYIATAHKLQVGHPPGAPTFQLIGRFFSMFTDPYHAAYAVNCMSAVCSGLGIMFLFWSITLLGKKLISDDDISLKNSKVWAIFASGIIGSMAYTFTDTYWFSAVEGEVYAMSSFFTAVVFWAALKWDEQADDTYSYRWLILICLLIGVAIGVHLLNLLTIPAIVYMVYFKKFYRKGMSSTQTVTGFLVSGVISVALLGLVLWAIIPGVVNLSSDFDVFFVNKLHMGFNSGTIFYFLLIAIFILWALWNNSNLKRPSKLVNIIVIACLGLSLLIVKIGVGTFSVGFFFMLIVLAAVVYFVIKSRNRAIVNASVLGFFMILVGYSTFFVLVIRANTNTPLNENAPKDAVALRAYLGREQYGQTPFLSGAYYTAGNPIGAKNEYAKYIRTKDEQGRDYYKVASYAQKYIYKEDHTGVFPRMWSPDNGRQHPLYYEYWAGHPLPGDRPSFVQNIKFLNRYQLNWMYWRYFMWNFAGRQNDIQGHHFDDNVAQGNAHIPTIDYLHGNWISGIKFVDEQRLGPQDNLPDELANNKARNRYYMLPLLLGLLGLVYHFRRRPQDAFVTLIMFFMTGLAIAIYLNMPPKQPRERDYAFVGSFYFFCIWVGLGVYALYDWLSSRIESKERNVFLIASAVCILLGLLLKGGWFVLAMMGVVGIFVTFVRIPKWLALGVAFLLSASVPIILCAENWDDHDRSQKTAARDFAKNYLGLMDEDGILITFGDNDTFPLWYIQEVEEFRTDVRILNYTLSGMHWYVEQLFNKLYQSDALPFTLPKDMYGLGHEIFILNPNGPRMEVTDALSLVKNNRKQYVSLDRDADSVVSLPTNKFKITLDKPKLVARGVITQQMADSIPDFISFDINLRRGYLMRSEMMMLDILGTNRFERSVCIMNPGYIRDVFPVVDNYSVQEGMIFKLVPYPTPKTDLNFTPQTVDYFLNGIKKADGSYDTLSWGNLDRDIYVDPISNNMGSYQRQSFAILAIQCAQNGDTVAARQLLAKAESSFPKANFVYDMPVRNVVHAYMSIGDQVNAYRVWCEIAENCIQYIDYFNQFAKKETWRYNVNPLLQTYRDWLVDMARFRQRYTGRGDALTLEGEELFAQADPYNKDRLDKIDAVLATNISVAQ